MQRRRFVLVYSAAWSVMACVFAVLIQASSSPMPVAVALIAGVNNAIPGALLGLVAWRLATRLATCGWPTPAFVGIHLLLALAYTALWTGVIVAVLAAVSPVGLADFLASGGLGWQLMGGGLFYIVVAGIAHGRFVTLRNHELAAAAARSEALRIQAELQALRARLDPHFLFNTLHSIMALVRRDASAGERALERLGDLLRRVLSLNRERAEELPLADELDFIRDFLALEALRLGDRLNVIEDIDPDALDCLVPVLTLQPLVENAIRHGIAVRPEGGTLRIAARLEQGRLCVEVEDDGPGLATAGTQATVVGTQAAEAIEAIGATEGIQALETIRAAEPVLTADPVQATERVQAAEPAHAAKRVQAAKRAHAGHSDGIPVTPAHERESDEASRIARRERRGTGRTHPAPRPRRRIPEPDRFDSEADHRLHGARQGRPPGPVPPGPAQSMATFGDEPGIGIQLVRQRLEARHGGSARLELLGGTTGGVRARITLPARTVPVHAGMEAG